MEKKLESKFQHPKGSPKMLNNIEDEEDVVVMQKIYDLQMDLRYTVHKSAFSISRITIISLDLASL